MDVALRKHAELCSKLSGNKERLTVVINEKLARVVKLFKGINKVTESSIVEIALLLYFSQIWESLPEEKKTGLKLVLEDDEVFSLGSEMKKMLNC